MNITEDVFIYKIFPLLNIKDRINLLLTCTLLCNIIKKIKFINVFAERGKRLNKYELNKYNQPCSIVLDRIHRINNLSFYHPDTNFNKYLLITAKVHTNGFIIPGVSIRYTTDKWKNHKDIQMCYYKSMDIWYCNIYEHGIEWFALKIGFSPKEMWDNNNGWNYSISEEHHYISNNDYYSIEFVIPTEIQWRNDLPLINYHCSENEYDEDEYDEYEDEYDENEDEYDENEHESD